MGIDDLVNQGKQHYEAHKDKIDGFLNSEQAEAGNETTAPPGSVAAMSVTGASAPRPDRSSVGAGGAPVCGVR